MYSYVLEKYSAYLNEHIEEESLLLNSRININNESKAKHWLQQMFEHLNALNSNTNTKSGHCPGQLQQPGEGQVQPPGPALRYGKGAMQKMIKPFFCVGQDGRPVPCHPQFQTQYLWQGKAEGLFLVSGPKKLAQGCPNPDNTGAGHVYSKVHHCYPGLARYSLLPFKQPRALPMWLYDRPGLTTPPRLQPWSVKDL